MPIQSEDLTDLKLELCSNPVEKFHKFKDYQKYSRKNLAEWNKLSYFDQLVKLKG